MEQVGVEGTIAQVWPLETEMPVRGSTATSTKAVRETGLKFWGEFGARVKFGATSMGSRVEPEARMT